MDHDLQRKIKKVRQKGLESVKINSFGNETINHRIDCEKRTKYSKKSIARNRESFSKLEELEKTLQ